MKSNLTNTESPEQGHCAGESLAPDAPALARFAQLLEKRSCDYWQENELEQVLPIRRTKPDFFVHTPSKVQLLVEIKSFKKERSALLALRQNAVMSGLTSSDERRFVNTTVQHASRQLKPYRNLNFPSLVILDDFQDVGMPTNPDILGLCLMESFPKRDWQHISAVAWLLGGTELSPYLRIFHNPYATKALPLEAFGAQADEHWYQLPGQFWKRHI